MTDPTPGRMQRLTEQRLADALLEQRIAARHRATDPHELIPATGQTWEGRARCAWARAMAGGLLDDLDRQALDRHPEPLGVDGRTRRPRLDDARRFRRERQGDWTPPLEPPPTRPRSSTPPGPPPPTPFDRGMAGSELAGRVKWTDDERLAVDRAIAGVALRLEEFTADDVWRQLDGAVPVTKGLAGRLTAAVNEGLIANTGRTTIAARGGAHDHAQRLTVWRSLVCER